MCLSFSLLLLARASSAVYTAYSLPVNLPTNLVRNTQFLQIIYPILPKRQAYMSSRQGPQIKIMKFRSNFKTWEIWMSNVHVQGCGIGMGSNLKLGMGFQILVDKVELGQGWGPRWRTIVGPQFRLRSGAFVVRRSILNSETYTQMKITKKDPKAASWTPSGSYLYGVIMDTKIMKISQVSFPPTVGTDIYL